MTGAAAEEPDVLCVRMAIDDEIAVGAVLVLADFRRQQRRLRELREALAEELARALDALRARDALHRRRIDGLATRVVGDLEPLPVDARHAVDDVRAEVDPDRQLPDVVAV